RDNLPTMVVAGIIKRCVSPWSSKTTFPRKSNGELRIVHHYLALNDAIVKKAYPMRKSNLSSTAWC
ncbi:uncharacterized protein BO66DRAFT_332676, partial [Aspergillus aculeatinus CBS 121060]